MPTKTKSHARLYVKTRVRPRWRREIKSAERSLFFSPYVTGKCAQRVLLVAGAGTVELYTVFTAENFASRGSSLGCLRKLIEGGVKVYHLAGLHAKMLLVPGRAITVGSQNLTTRGQDNREATVLTTDGALVRQAEVETEAWVKERVAVTLAMIDDMVKRVRPLRKLFKAAQDAAEEIDEQVRAAQRERDEAERRARLERAGRERLEREQKERELVRQRQQQRHQQRLLDLQASVRKLRVAGTVVRARLKTPTSLRHGLFDYTTSKSILALGDGSLTHWQVGRDIVTLKDCYRYLCIIEETGKLGWARVASSRISFVASNISRERWLDYRGVKWNVSTTGKWKGLNGAGYNLVVTLESLFRGKVELRCWFSVDGLEVESTAWKTPRPDGLPDDFAPVLAQNEAGTRDKLTQFLVMPFKFIDGQKLTGASAGGYFGDTGRRFNIKLAKVGEHEVLLANKLW
jgi:hypothetical protein